MSKDCELSAKANRVRLIVTEGIMRDDKLIIISFVCCSFAIYLLVINIFCLTIAFDLRSNKWIAALVTFALVPVHNNLVAASR